jgi:TFIIF-interacting CTD phosphatase-like protein
VFTEEIAKKILETAPKNNSKYFSYILNKEHCSKNESHHEIKNLDLFVGEESGRQLKDCIIIDNSIYCFQRQLTNGLIIPKFLGQPDDDWLFRL